MQKLLDSERQQLQTARTELMEMKEAGEDKLTRLQEKLTLKEEEFRGRDAARAEQLEAAMDAHNADRSRLMLAAAKSRESAEAVLVAHEADKVQIFELKSSLAKMQDSEAELKAKAEESALQTAKAEATVLRLTSLVEEQKDAFFTEAKDMEANHAASFGMLQQNVDDAEAAAEQQREVNERQAELIASLRDRMQAAKEEVETANEELLKSQDEASELRTTASALKKELDRAAADATSERTGASDSDEQVTKLKISVCAANARIEELTTQLEARDASLQKSKSQVAEMECKKDIMRANIGTLEAKLSTALRHEQQIQSVTDDEVARLQMQMNELQSSLVAATQESARAQESEQQARELWREGEKQVHAQLEMLDAMNKDVAQLREEKVAAETLAADEKVVAEALHKEVQALTATKASIVCTIATQTSPLKARKSTSHVLSDKLATLQKQAEQMREDTIHMIGQGPTPRSAISAGQALVIPRVVPDKLCIVTPGSGKQAPAKKPRVYRPSPARVTSAPMESPSPPRVGEIQAEELAAQAAKFGPVEDADFFERNPGIQDAVDSPLLSAKRSAMPSPRPVSPTTPSEASEALRKLRAQEQNRATRPPPVPAEALSEAKSPSDVPIPNTPSGKLPASIASTSTMSSSRWGPPHEAAHEEVVWPAERRTTTSTTGQPSLSEELTWLHSPGV
jgi:chromosome segregation ATPase